MFSAWDCQCHQYFNSGANSNTREQCVDDVLDMLMVDVEEGVEKLPKEELLELFEVDIHEHKEKI